MKNIIAAFDGLLFSESTMQYAIFLAKQSHTSLTGVFLSEHSQLSYAVYETLIEQSHTGKSLVNEISRQDMETIQTSMQFFESECERAGIRYLARYDKNDAGKHLVNETIFADLLVIQAGDAFSYTDNAVPSRFVRNILQHTHCPVIAVPAKFNPITSLAFLYDGSTASVDAIKVVHDTLPGLKNVRIRLICADKKRGHPDLPANQMFWEWMNNHYPQAEYKFLKGTENEIIGLLAGENPGMLIVTGAYNRSQISMLIKSSFADELIHDLKAPVFISHM